MNFLIQHFRRQLFQTFFKLRTQNNLFPPFEHYEKCFHDFPRIAILPLHNGKMKSREENSGSGWGWSTWKCNETPLSLCNVLLLRWKICLHVCKQKEMKICTWDKSWIWKNYRDFRKRTIENFPVCYIRQQQIYDYVLSLMESVENEVVKNASKSQTKGKFSSKTFFRCNLQLFIERALVCSGAIASILWSFGGFFFMGALKHRR